MKHRSILALSILTWAFCGPSSAQNVYDLAQIADGRFGGGSILTTFILSNNGDREAAVALETFDDRGDPLPIPIAGLAPAGPLELLVSPGQTRVLRTAGVGPLTAGSARIVSSVPIGVSALFTILDPSGGTQTEAGVGTSLPLRDFVIAVDAGETVNTGLAVRNLEAAETVLTVALLDAEGQARGVPIQISLAGNGHLARFVSDDLFGPLGEFRGQLRVAANGDVAALTLRQTQSPNSLTTLGVVASDASETEFLLPQIGNGGDLLRTTLVLLNLSTTANLVTVQLTDDQGEPLPVGLSDGQQGGMLNVDLPPLGVRFLETDGSGEARAGAARVVSQRPAAVSAILSILDGLGGPLTATGVGASPEITAATIPVEETASQSTGVALFNNTSETAIVSFRNNDPPQILRAGIDRGPILLPPGHHLARFASQLVPDLDEFSKSISFQSTVPLATVTLRQAGDGSTLTTLPVFPEIHFSPGRALPSSLPPMEIGSDTVLDQTLPEALELSGSVSFPGFLDLIVAVTATDEAGRLFEGGPYGPQEYRIFLEPGTYTIRFTYSLRRSSLDTPPQGERPRSSSVTAIAEFPGITVAANTLRNFRVQETPTRHAVSGRITDLAASLPPELRQFPPTLQFLSADSPTAGGTTTADDDGSYGIALAVGTYSVSLLTLSLRLSIPPQLSQITNLPLGSITVDGPLQADFPAPDLVRLSGALTTSAPLANPFGSAVTAFNATDDPEAGLDLGFSLGAVDLDGQYLAFLLRDRDYQLQASVSTSSPEENSQGLLSSPIRGAVPRERFEEDAVRDFQFPPLPEFATLSGRVSGANGPLGGVTVTAASQTLGSPDLEFSGTAFTDGEGFYSIRVPVGTDYDVSFSFASRRIVGIIRPLPDPAARSSQ